MTTKSASQWFWARWRRTCLLSCCRSWRTRGFYFPKWTYAILSSLTLNSASGWQTPYRGPGLVFPGRTWQNSLTTSCSKSVEGVAPENLINFDESTVKGDPRTSCIICKKGQKYVETVQKTSQQVSILQYLPFFRAV
jgi:hypothetical protein